MHWVLWICEELGREACSLDGRAGEIGEEELLVTEFDPLLKREERGFCEKSVEAGLKPVLRG